MKKSIYRIRLKGDLLDRVRQAGPIARLILRDGLSNQSANLPGEYVPCGEPKGLNDEQMKAFCHHMDALFAVGIAVGLLLRPEAVDKVTR
jgi:hypothetical protein